MGLVKKNGRGQEIRTLTVVLPKHVCYRYTNPREDQARQLTGSEDADRRLQRFTTSWPWTC